MIYRTTNGYILTSEDAKRFCENLNHAPDLSYIDETVRITNTKQGFIAECDLFCHSNARKDINRAKGSFNTQT